MRLQPDVITRLRTYTEWRIAETELAIKRGRAELDAMQTELAELREQLAELNEYERKGSESI